MGLLDDAIREHLDLKRRRGADPSEVAREEAEALGPVRREAPEEEPHGSVAAGSYADHEPAALDEPAVAYDDERPADDEYEYEDDIAAVRADDRDRPHPADPPTTHDDAWAEPESESATPPHGDPLAHQPTREFSSIELDEALGEREAPPARREPVDDAADNDDAADDDELDQTPDFLQETPEHDRLWFEQKPPKDFDF
jgi:hypothetical protein